MKRYIYIGWIVIGPIVLACALTIAWRVMRSYPGSCDQEARSEEIRDAMDAYASMVIAIIVAICGGAVTAVERVQAKREAARASRQPVPSSEDLAYRTKSALSELRRVAPWLSSEVGEILTSIGSVFQDRDFVTWLESAEGGGNQEPSADDRRFTKTAAHVRQQCEHLRDLLALPDGPFGPTDHRGGLLQAARAIENAARLRILAIDGDAIDRTSRRLVWLSAGIAATIVAGIFSPDILWSRTLRNWIGACAGTDPLKAPTPVVFTFLAYSALAVGVCAYWLRDIYMKAIRL